MGTNKNKSPKINNLVAKYAAEYCKPKTFRNRKKEHKIPDDLYPDELKHVKARPYKRPHKNYTRDIPEELDDDGSVNED